VRDADAVALLERLVALRSPPGRERAAADALVAAMAATADRAYVDEAGNAVGEWGRGPVNVTFLGHLDTAPGWPPVRCEDGVLYGRGSVDAKGSLCAAVCAVARSRTAWPQALSVRVIGAVEEEAPSSRGARHAMRAYPRPDHLVVCEPSGWDRYTVGYKGALTVTLRGVTEARHGSRDEPSAAELVVDAFAAVRGWVAERNAGVEGIFDRLQLRLVRVSSRSDGLAERCVARLGLRLPPSLPWRRAADALRALPLPDGVSLAARHGLDACLGDARSELARAFRVAVREAGGSPSPVRKAGTSDWNVVARSWAVPTLAYGPGDSSLDHAPDERLPVADYLRSIEVVSRALQELAAAGPRDREPLVGDAAGSQSTST
jgi:LysW-gamma-L-lysine carboxypeptidase